MSVCLTVGSDRRRYSGELKRAALTARVNPISRFRLWSAVPCSMVSRVVTVSNPVITPTGQFGPLRSEMHTVETTISIAAPPAAVWDVLVDFESYHEWNPFIRRGAGVAAAGSELTLEVQPPGDKAMTHHPTVTVAEPVRHLQWLGVVRTPLLFGGRHEFILEPEGEGTKLRQREYFTGVAVLFLKKTLRRTEEGFHALNRALKQRAEHSAGVRRVD